MINILIVEDDSKQRKNLSKIIKELDSTINVYEADNRKDALKIAEEVEINCFLIDMILKDSNGLDLAIKIREISKYKLTWIIFITNLIDYMLKAFKEVHCYDYILKPYKKENLKQTMKLLIEDHYKKVASKKIEHIFMEIKDGAVKIVIDDIYFIEKKDRICIIHTKEGIYEVGRVSLKNIVEKINRSYIIQTHKSFAVNVNYIRKLEKLSKTCWEIYFFGYEKIAYLTNTYKENMEHTII